MNLLWFWTVDIGAWGLCLFINLFHFPATLAFTSSQSNDDSDHSSLDDDDDVDSDDERFRSDNQEEVNWFWFQHAYFMGH